MKPVLVLRGIGEKKYLCSKGVAGPRSGVSHLLSQRVFPSANESWMFRREQFHFIVYPQILSFNPDWTHRVEVHSFTLLTAVSAIPFVTDRRGVDLSRFHKRSSQTFVNSNEISV